MARHYSRSAVFLASLLVFLLADIGPARADTELYFTDFEDFTVGDGNLAGASGMDGWLVAPATEDSAQGIDDGLLSGLGKTAFIGYNQPDQTFTTVAYPVAYDPATTGVNRIVFTTLLGIQDSVEKPQRDSFFVTFRNLTGGVLGAIRFANEPTSFGIWRLDGSSTEIDTLVDFVLGEIYVLRVEIDLAANQWSASINVTPEIGAPLFTDVEFNATGETLTLGTVAMEWQLSAAFPVGHGDNFLLFDEFTILMSPEGTEPFEIDSFSRTGSNQSVVNWTAEPGFEYQVTYSTDLATWLDDLPGSMFDPVTSTQPMSYTDTTATSALSRFYRVIRTCPPE